MWPQKHALWRALTWYKQLSKKAGNKEYCAPTKNRLHLQSTYISHASILSPIVQLDFSLTLGSFKLLICASLHQVTNFTIEVHLGSCNVRLTGLGMSVWPSLSCSYGWIIFLIAPSKSKRVDQLCCGDMSFIQKINRWMNLSVQYIYQFILHIFFR